MNDWITECPESAFPRIPEENLQGRAPFEFRWYVDMWERIGRILTARTDSVNGVRHFTVEYVSGEESNPRES